MRRSVHVVGILWLLLTGFVSVGQSAAPVLRIETGMHGAAANAIATDKAGKYLLTCSDDKTARLWDAATGELLRTIRVPIGNVDEGKLYACALSPDGTTAALGGRTKTGHQGIYLVNVQTGQMLPLDACLNNFYRYSGLGKMAPVVSYILGASDDLFDLSVERNNGYLEDTTYATIPAAPTHYRIAFMDAANAAPKPYPQILAARRLLENSLADSAAALRQYGPGISIPLSKKLIDSAWTFITEALNYRQHRAYVYSLIGSYWQSHNQPSIAKDYYWQSIAADSNFAYPYYRLAYIYAPAVLDDKQVRFFSSPVSPSASRLDSAISYAQKLTELDKFPAFCIMVARLQRARGNPAAEESIRKAIASGGSIANIWQHLGRYYAYFQSYDTAAQCYRHMVDIDSSYVSELQNEPFVTEVCSAAAFPPAERLLLHALAQNPEESDAYQLLGDLYRNYGHFQQAADIYERSFNKFCQIRDDGRIQAYYTGLVIPLVSLYTDSLQYPLQSARFFQRYALFSPTDGYLYLTRVYSKQHNLPEAETSFKKLLITIDQSDDEYKDKVGMMNIIQSDILLGKLQELPEWTMLLKKYGIK